MTLSENSVAILRFDTVASELDFRVCGYQSAAFDRLHRLMLCDCEQESSNLCCDATQTGRSITNSRREAVCSHVPSRSPHIFSGKRVTLGHYRAPTWSADLYRKFYFRWFLTFKVLNIYHMKCGYSRNKVLGCAILSCFKSLNKCSLKSTARQKKLCEGIVESSPSRFGSGQRMLCRF